MATLFRQHSTTTSPTDAGIEAYEPGSCILYSYWRSSCSWRVRIALAIKGIPYQYRPVNLLDNQQADTDYETINPGKVVPTLVIDNMVLTQSVAILEYLEERRPESWRLMPVDASERAQVRMLMQMIVSDIQPVQNLKVLVYAGADRKMEWGKHWITQGFMALEKALKRTHGRYCVGDTVTLADVCLVPQVYNAHRFGVDMSAFPIIVRIDQELSQLPAFQAAHPDQQPDAVKSS